MDLHDLETNIYERIITKRLLHSNRLIESPYSSVISWEVPAGVPVPCTLLNTAYHRSSSSISSFTLDVFWAVKSNCTSNTASRHSQKFATVSYTANRILIHVFNFTHFYRPRMTKKFRSRWFQQRLCHSSQLFKRTWAKKSQIREKNLHCLNFLTTMKAIRLALCTTHRERFSFSRNQ